MVEQNKNDPHNRFDNIMSRIFSYKEMLIDMLEFFVKEDWIKDLDYDSLKEEKTDFVAPKNLKPFQSDVLWLGKIKDKDIYIYIHTEFQSIPDRLMPYRFLTYQHMLYNHLLINRKKQEKSDLLPFVFPILFYHGERNWNFETDIQNLVEKPFKNAEKYIPNFNFFKIMINEKTYQELIDADSVLSSNFACNTIESSEQFLKTIRKVSKLIAELIPENKRKELSDDLSLYLSFISNDNLKLKDIRNILNRYEEDKMGLAEVLRKEKEEVRKQGKIEGKIEGFKEAEEKAEKEKIELIKKAKQEKIEFIKRMKKANISIEQISEISGFTIEEVEEIIK